MVVLTMHLFLCALGKSWSSITTLCQMGTLRSTGKTTSKRGLTSLPERPEEELVGISVGTYLVEVLNLSLLSRVIL